MNTTSTVATWTLSLMIALMGSGCGPGSSGSSGASTSEAGLGGGWEWPAAGVEAADRLEWNRRTLVEAYETVGVRSDLWDGSAREALELFAQIRCGTNSAAFHALATALQAASDAGCRDPLIRYLRLRYVHGRATAAGTDAAEEYREVADEVLRSSYPDARKFYAAIRAAQAWKSAFGSSAETSKVLGHYRRAAFEPLQAMLRSPDTPFLEAYEAAEELSRTIAESRQNKDVGLPVLIDYFLARWPSEPRALAFSGQAHIQLAWNRRGGDYASTVSEEVWKGFAHHLELAAQCLEKSWSIDPSMSDTAVAMMSVELGQGKGRKRLEVWFERAMELDPACYDATRAKVWYLQPKWHGSEREALAFGRECVASQVWKGQVPLTLWLAHTMLANDRATGLKDAHWQRPGVWQDVQASFERFFELNPSATGWYQEYAFYAFKCGQFGKFLDLVPLMGSIDYSRFGGEARFGEMITEAETGADRKLAVPVGARIAPQP